MINTSLKSKELLQELYQVQVNQSIVYLGKLFSPNTQHFAGGDSLVSSWSHLWKSLENPPGFLFPTTVSKLSETDQEGSVSALGGKMSWPHIAT